MLGKSLAADVNWNILLDTPHNYLEIGCYDGCNLVFVANRFPDKKIFGVDPFLNEGDLGKQERILLEQKNNLYSNINKVSNINFFEMTDTDFLKTPPLSFKDLNVSSIFIDGAHVLEFIKTDIEIAINCILNNQTKTGIVVFHDLHIIDVVQGIKFFKDRCSEEGIICEQKQNGYYFVKKD